MDDRIGPKPIINTPAIVPPKRMSEFWKMTKVARFKPQIKKMPHLLMAEHHERVRLLGSKLRKAAVKGSGLALRAPHSRPARPLSPRRRNARTGRLTVRLSRPVVAAGQAPFWCALTQGFYRRRHLDVQLTLNRERKSALRSLFDGTADIVITRGPESAHAAMRDYPGLVIAGLLHRNSNFSCLLVPEDSSIRGFSDLAGKRIGVCDWLNSRQVTEEMLRLLGIQAEQVETGDGANALRDGRLDARSVYRPFAERMEPRVPWRLLDLREVGVRSHGLTICTTSELIHAKSQVLADFISATEEGAQFACAHPEHTMAILSQCGDKNDPVQMRRQLDRFNAEFSMEDGRIEFSLRADDLSWPDMQIQAAACPDLDFQLLYGSLNV